MLKMPFPSYVSIIVCHFRLEIINISCDLAGDLENMLWFTEIALIGNRITSTLPLLYEIFLNTFQWLN